jgi:outer membrane protein OmpA-like peptidoglycan-associated protein
MQKQADNRGDRVMRAYKCAAAALVAAAIGSPALAQGDMPWVEVESTSVMLGVGGQSGDGVLRLPNLGTNCSYPFKVDGFGAGIQVGISKISAAGAVKNMNNVGDLIGSYSAMQGESTLIAGAAATSMKNRYNNVVIDLQSRTQGIALGFNAQGMNVRMNDVPPNAPRVFVAEFGYNKDWVGDDARARLTPLINAWKCRFVKFEVVGHTDTVGKEDKNLELSDKRAKAVRDYLIGAGVVPGRIMTRAAGENEPLAPTGQGVRARINRAVVVFVR